MEHIAPIFHVPLSDKDLHQLGRLAAIWGQMDWLLTLSIAGTLGIAAVKCETILDKMPTAGKVARLKSLSAHMKDEENRRQSILFCKQVESVLGQRNHLTHGVWVLFSPDGLKPYKPACYFPTNKKAMIRATELPRIADRTVEVTNLLASLFSRANGLEEATGVPDQNRRVYMGFGPPQERYKGTQGGVYWDLYGLGHSQPEQ